MTGGGSRCRPRPTAATGRPQRLSGSGCCRMEARPRRWCGCGGRRRGRAPRATRSRSGWRLCRCWNRPRWFAPALCSLLSALCSVLSALLLSPPVLFSCLLLTVRSALSYLPNLPRVCLVRSHRPWLHAAKYAAKEPLLTACFVLRARAHAGGRSGRLPGGCPRRAHQRLQCRPGRNAWAPPYVPGRGVAAGRTS